MLPLKSLTEELKFKLSLKEIEVLGSYLLQTEYTPFHSNFTHETLRKLTRLRRLPKLTRLIESPISPRLYKR